MLRQHGLVVTFVPVDTAGYILVPKSLLPLIPSLHFRILYLQLVCLYILSVDQVRIGCKTLLG